MENLTQRWTQFLGQNQGNDFDFQKKQGRSSPSIPTPPPSYLCVCHLKKKTSMAFYKRDALVAVHKSDWKKDTQARNQEFFRAGKFSWNQGTLVNNHVQHEKEILPRREKSPVLFLGTLKNCILNAKFNPQMSTIRAFCPKLGHFFSIFEKGQGRRPSSRLQLRA